MREENGPKRDQRKEKGEEGKEKRNERRAVREKSTSKIKNNDIKRITTKTAKTNKQGH